MPFDRSLILKIDYRPWRWTTPPVYDGPVIVTPGVSQELNGVFILLSDEIVELLANSLTTEQKDELRGWIYRVNVAEATEWHVPLWAGETKGIFLRIPAAVWNNPAGTPPAKVKNYLQNLWREVVEQ